MAQSKPDGYQKSLAKHGLSPKALQWSSYESQARRLREIIKDIDFERKTVLDIGCGFADVISFISSKTKEYTYTGVDIVPEFIEYAKGKYPEHSFEVRNYFVEPLESNFDIIMTSGTLNNNGDDVIENRKKSIAMMFEHANEAFVFNMAGNYPQPNNSPESRVYYANSLEIVEYCFSLTHKLVLRHDYHDKDFTVVMFK